MVSKEDVTAFEVLPYINHTADIVKTFALDLSANANRHENTISRLGDYVHVRDCPVPRKFVS